MEKPTKRTVAIPYGHGFKTRPLEFYHPLEVDAYIAHLEQRAEAAEAKVKDLEQEQAEHDGQIANLQGKFDLALAGLRSKTSRCDKAEGKLAELEKREPYGYVHKSIYESCGSCGLTNEHDKYCDSPSHIPLFTRPAPAINLAELVPDNALREIDGVIDWINGLPIPTRSATKWLIKMSDLRAAILRNIEEAK